MVAPAGDLDGDGADDLAIGCPWHRSSAGERAGRVEFRSGRSGESLGEIIGDTADAWAAGTFTARPIRTDDGGRHC